MENLLVMDVANVYLKDLETGKLFATATTSTNSVNTSLNEEPIKAGWGGGTVATINSEKTTELNFSDVFFSMDYVAMQQGTVVEEGKTTTVLQDFTATVVDNAGGLEVVVPTEVTATSAIMADLDGTQDPVTITGNKITIPVGSVAKAGDEVQFFYEKEVTGQRVSVDSANFPKNYEILFHTRAFNPDTNVIAKDLYIRFFKCKAGGNSGMELGINQAAPSEMTFTALNKSKNSTEMGEYWAVERV